MKKPFLRPLSKHKALPFLCVCRRRIMFSHTISWWIEIKRWKSLWIDLLLIDLLGAFNERERHNPCLISILGAHSHCFLWQIDYQYWMIRLATQRELRRIATKRNNSEITHATSNANSYFPSFFTYFSCNFWLFFHVLDKKWTEFCRIFLNGFFAL